MTDTNQLPCEREAFEAFAQNCPMGKYSITRRGDGYDSSHTQLMWDAWQARAQVQGEPMAWMHWLNGPVRVFMNKDVAMMELDRLNREYPLDADDRKMRPLIFGDTAPQPAQATQAEVTDAEIESLFGKCGGHWSGDQWVIEDADLHPFCRAILALRPVQVPMTDAEASDMIRETVRGNALRREGSTSLQIVRATERYYGITAQAKKEVP